MSAPDVYEELGRLVQTHQDREESNPPSAYAALAYLTARELVEFLRWRSAREEWPAEGCRCAILSEVAPSLDRGVKHLTLLKLDGAGLQELHGPRWWVRHEVTRWRYALGPCSCVVRVAGPEKEG